MATFEERLTKLRTKAGVSQQAIGDALNVSRWAVHNYEAGKNRPCLLYTSPSPRDTR